MGSLQLHVPVHGARVRCYAVPVCDKAKLLHNPYVLARVDKRV